MFDFIGAAGGKLGLSRRWARAGAAVVVETLAMGAFLGVGATAQAQAQAAQAQAPSALTLWYTSPATNWLDALPIGNGRLGAMVFGKADEERVQLNENTLWDGFPRDTTNPDALKNLPEVRRLLFAG